MIQIPGMPSAHSFFDSAMDSGGLVSIYKLFLKSAVRSSLHLADIASVKA